MKKLISLFLALTMVFSLAMPAMAAETTRTIYFENTGNWSAVYAYAYDDSGTNYPNPWPGSAMTKVVGETNIYSIEVSTAATKVIFNNNNNGVQSADLTIPTDGNDLYSYGSGTWSKYAKKSGDVTASYTPTITISGVTISGDSVTTEGTTYTVTIPADETFVDVTVTVSGQNLDKIAVDDYSYMVSIGNLTYLIKASDYDPDTGKAVASFTLEASDIGTADLQYSTDGGSTWVSTGWNVVIQQAEPTPTAVSLKAKLKAVDSAGAEITDTMIASLDGNTVVNTEIREFNVIFTGDKTMTWDTIPSGYQTPADVSLTVTDDGNGNGVLTSNSSHATVTTETIDGKSVYVITVELAAESTEVSEAKWGASMDSLTGSGTLAEAIAAAEADSTVKYIQLQSDVTAESSFVITSGEFTIDLNGRTVTYNDGHTFNVQNSGTKVTFADSGATGAVTSGGATHAAITTYNGGEVQITGGSYSGFVAVNIEYGASAAISGGTFTSTHAYAINNAGTLTISGGTFDGSGSEGNFSYYSGTLDLSGYSDVTGLKVSQWTGSDLAVSDTTIKLPANYTFVDDSNNPVTTLAYSVVYTIAAVSGGEDTTYTVTVNTAENGTVFADKEIAAEGETVTLTWSTEGTYELDTIVVKDTDGNAVTITDKGLTAWTFTMPAFNVTVTATFKEIATTSADIVWGSLAYTYTDEAGAWSNDGSEKAGTVTVTNTGTTAITATPSYAAATDEYGTFTGSFDVASADLDAGASKTFTLSLSGTPTKAIPAGTKIGSVTITINKAAEG